jgi:tRNA modification GTPase
MRLLPKDKQLTIAAIATPRGYGGVGIVRVSGTLVPTIAQAITARLLPPRQAVYTKLLAQDNTIIDEGIALFFPGPGSFTGEDVLELQGHGGPVVLDCLLQRVLDLGAVLAKPGEFSERAFLNGRVDLTQAEAIASLIAAQSVMEARAAVRSLQGGFSNAVQAVATALMQLRQHVEAGIDFPEDEIDLLAEAKVGETIVEIQENLTKLLQQTQQGVLLADGLKTVIVGKVNAGKSSLLNLLTEREAAIVTDIPGTTRDLLKEIILLDGIKLELIDTAGLRETVDVVEKEGVRRAVAALEQAELILLVVACSEIKNFSVQQQYPKVWERINQGAKLLVLYNKIDLLGAGDTVAVQEDIPLVKLSAKTGAGKEVLLQELKKLVGWEEAENVFIARRRHLAAIQQARKHINNSTLCWQQYGNGELLAEELRLTQQKLGEITGECSSEDLLEKIFSEFCIGK